LSTVEAVRALLPSYVPFVAPALVLATSFVSVALGLAAADLLATGRRSRWPSLALQERARRSVGASIGEIFTIFALVPPLAFAAKSYAGPVGYLSSSMPALQVVTALVAWGLVRQWSAKRMLLPTRGRLERLRGMAVTWLLLQLEPTVLLALAAFCPPALGPRAWALIGVGALTSFVVGFDPGLDLARLFGLLRPAPERLVRAVEAAATRCARPVPRALLVRSQLLVSYSFALRGVVLVSDRVLEDLSDDELEALMVDLVTQLEAPRSIDGQRSVAALALVPTVWLPLVVSSYGPMAGLVLFPALLWLHSVLDALAAGAWQERARRLASVRQGSPEAYARAVQKMGEANLSPSEPALVTLGFAIRSFGAGLAGVAVGVLPVLALYFGHPERLVDGDRLADCELRLAIDGGSADSLLDVGASWLADDAVERATPFIELAHASFPFAEPAAALSLVRSLQHRCEEARALLAEAEVAFAKRKCGGDEALLEHARLSVKYLCAGGADAAGSD
jgi:Zn-dependent protease with chaperone function